MDNLFDMSKFDEYEEDNRREVKRAKSGLPASLWETYSSFSNCYGGVIILGVVENDDKTWTAVGVDDPHKMLKEFWDAINNKQKVSKNILTDGNIELLKAGHNEKDIIVIHVPAASRADKPIYLNNDMFDATYRRNWEGDYRCSEQEVRAMLRDETEDTPDMKIIESLTVEDLNYDTVHKYRNRHRLSNTGHPWNNLPDDEYLKMIGAALDGGDGKVHPTAAGLLMFGDEYRIVREFPEYFLDYREMLDPAIRWTDRYYSSTGEWSGNLFDFYFTVYNKIIKEIKVPFRVENGIRIDDTPVHKALREALANCLVNADFFLPRSVVVKLDRDRIVLENPGSIRTGKKQMLKGGISDPRNKALMKMFNLIDIGERAGSGVPDIYMVWANEGWDDPTVEEQYGPDRTILTLPLTKKSGDKKMAIKNGDKKPPTKRALAQYQIVLDFMKNGEDYTSSQIAEILGVKVNRTKVILQEMIALNLIETVGSNRNRKYRRV